MRDDDPAGHRHERREDQCRKEPEEEEHSGEHGERARRREHHELGRPHGDARPGERPLQPPGPVVPCESTVGQLGRPVTEAADHRRSVPDPVDRRGPGELAATHPRCEHERESDHEAGEEHRQSDPQHGAARPEAGVGRRGCPDRDDVSGRGGAVPGGRGGQVGPHRATRRRVTVADAHRQLVRAGALRGDCEAVLTGQGRGDLAVGAVERVRGASAEVARPPVA